MRSGNLTTATAIKGTLLSFNEAGANALRKPRIEVIAINQAVSGFNEAGANALRKPIVQLRQRLDFTVLQ